MNTVPSLSDILEGNIDHRWNMFMRLEFKMPIEMDLYKWLQEKYPTIGVDVIEGQYFVHLVSGAIVKGMEDYSELILRMQTMHRELFSALGQWSVDNPMKSLPVPTNT